MTTQFQFFQVGGCVRDRFLGVTKIKDIDWSVVVTGAGDAEASFQAMVDHVTERSEKVFLVKPDCFTVRALSKQLGGAVDFVMARREFFGSTSRVPVRVEAGTLEDDLRRRDFTVNALALTESGELVDLFGGMRDLKRKVLDTPLEPMETFLDDPLRLLRGVRFCVKLGFKLSPRVVQTLREQHVPLMEQMERKVSGDRVRDELNKAFAVDTIKTLNLMRRLLSPDLFRFCLTAGGDSHLKLTNEQV